MDRKFIERLFDKGELINGCTDIKFTSAIPREQIVVEPKYFCINPLKPFTTRKDDNVKCFRNFMIEFDNIPITTQLSFIELLPIIPTTVVFSGNKSMHCIWSLETPIHNKEEWKIFATALADTIEKQYGNKIVDRACLNPSRLSRFAEFGANKLGIPLQELFWVKDRRVETGDFLTWIRDEIKPISPPRKHSVSSGDIKFMIGGPVFQILNDEPVDGRKMLMFSAGKELKHNGVDRYDAIDFLLPCTSLDEKTARHQISCAYRYE